MALYTYIVNNENDILKKYELIWTINNREDLIRHKTYLTEKNKNVRVINKKSLLGLLYYLTSRYIISTHGYFGTIGTSKNQIHICLWHGMPLKNIGTFLSDGSGTEGVVADYTIATSPFFREIVSKCMSIKEENIILSGEPRNDLLFGNNNSLKKIGIDKSKYKKIIMWMPTYRDTDISHIRNDGDSSKAGIRIVDNINFHDISNSLKDNSYLLILKLHPMDKSYDDVIKQGNNVVIIKNEDLRSNDIQLYEILAEVDILFTDYSSVYIDYMITEKPIAFVCFDFDEYSTNRGFVFDNVEDYLPGEIIKDYESLLFYINNLDKINASWISKYKHLNSLFNTYHKNSSCRTICDFFFR